MDPQRVEALMRKIREYMSADHRICDGRALAGRQEALLARIEALAVEPADA
jgi:hypothetical protein